MRSVWVRLRMSHLSPVGNKTFFHTILKPYIISMQFTPKAYHLRENTHTHTLVSSLCLFLLSGSYSPVAPWSPANVTIRPWSPCICQHITPAMENLISMDKVVYVLKFCRKPLMPGTKCGSKNKQISWLFLTKHNIYIYIYIYIDR